MKYTPEQLNLIAAYVNAFVEQDDYGNVVCNRDPDAVIGWRPVSAETCREAIEGEQ